jgi:hypothetical protein
MGIEFYDVLLRLAFGLPLCYAAYCEVEDLAVPGEPGRPPQRPLLEAISGGGTADVRVTAITRYHLGGERLTDWFRSGQVDVTQLISALAGEWDRPRHEELLYEVTVRYLSMMRGRYDQQAITDALRAHGYLAPALRERYPRSVPDQVTVLVAFLRAAHPAGLDRRAVADIISAPRLTRALLEAVLRELPDRADRKWAARLIADRIDGKGREEELLKLLTSRREG